MPSAIELTVDGYVRLNNHQALFGLRTHREHLAADLKYRQGQGVPFDYSKSIAQIEEDIAIINAGLRKLETQGGSS